MSDKLEQEARVDLECDDLLIAWKALQHQQAEVDRLKAEINEREDVRNTHIKWINQLQAENKQQAERMGNLIKAVENYLAAYGGGKKLCGHDFHCVCPTEMIEEALANAQSNDWQDSKGVSDE